MGDKKFYTVPFEWSRTLWIMTFAVFGLWFGLSVWLLWEIYTSEEVISYLVSLVLFNVTMLPTVLICEGLAPQRLEIGAQKMVILRRYRSVVVDADEVENIERLHKNALRGAIRTGGVSGFFGWYGNYYKSGIGSFKLYATSFDDLFLIKLFNGKKIVVSCSEPEKMEIFSKSVRC